MIAHLFRPHHQITTATSSASDETATLHAAVIMEELSQKGWDVDNRLYLGFPASSSRRIQWTLHHSTEDEGNQAHYTSDIARDNEIVAPLLEDKKNKAKAV